jgi:hypothetical protein
MALNFFNVIIKKQTYLNLIYLLLGFPLGIFYFTFLVTGISLGLGLAITLVGLPILLLMTVFWYWFGLFERTITSVLLNIEIAPMSNNALREKTFWNKSKKHLSNSATWKSLAYLIIKFPLGIIAFTLFVTLISVSIALIGTPIVYYFSTIYTSVNFLVIDGVEIVTSYWHAAIASIMGILALLISLHILNGLAYVSGLIAKVLLCTSNEELKHIKPVKQKKKAVKKKKVVKKKS